MQIANIPAVTGASRSTSPSGRRRGGRCGDSCVVDSTPMREIWRLRPGPTGPIRPAMGPRLAGLALVAAMVIACRRDPPQPGDAPCAPAPDVEGLRLDQLQVIGSHNSYRRRTYPPILAFVRNMTFSLSS